ncbi:hypothetical protein THTE_2026 [Thermogutta terrifontis]|uniref:Uncharacterized protein n=1 Tax=Thermogutta terrifontis TaxID=1331910 RepID=A0A286RF92_9BACT|nr:hypothetical protein THTE_2026 [Thermogutta terrifontis]
MSPQRGAIAAGPIFFDFLSFGFDEWPVTTWLILRKQDTAKIYRH